MANNQKHRVIYIPMPDYTNSDELKAHLERYRAAGRALAMMAEMDASELTAALSTIRPADGMFRRSRARRRARRVSRHLRHGGKCALAMAAAVVRTWGAFLAEYELELGLERLRRSGAKRKVFMP